MDWYRGYCLTGVQEGDEIDSVDRKDSVVTNSGYDHLLILLECLSSLFNNFHNIFGYHFNIVVNGNRIQLQHVM